MDWHSPVHWPLKTLYNTHQIHPFTNTLIHWWLRLPCKVPTAHQEQSGVQYHVQGFFSMQLGEWTSDLPITVRSYSQELKIPLKFWFSLISLAKGTSNKTKRLGLKWHPWGVPHLSWIGTEISISLTYHLSI